jgi:hypothetical protein
MATTGGIWHDADLANKVTRWVGLGQNVGVGSSCPMLTRAFWRSGPHHQNVLGRWRVVGVGVAVRRGRVYVTENFESWTNPGNVYSYPRGG